MNEQKIRQIVQEEYRKNNSNGRFGLQNIPYHIHNGADSPTVFQPNITYIGWISDVGTPILLPKGWTSSGGVGIYVVTHNLGNNALYVVTANASADTGSGFDVVAISNPNGINITFEVFEPSTHSLSVCGFFFQLTVVNNKSTTSPIYVN